MESILIYLRHSMFRSGRCEYGYDNYHHGRPMPGGYIIFSTLLKSPAIAPVGTSYAPGNGPRVPPGEMIVTCAFEEAFGITPVRMKSIAMLFASAAGGATAIIR
jgi:hypothetical protein